MRNDKQQALSDEVGMKDIADFIKRNQRLIMFWGFAGVMLSTAYVLLAPKKYEVKWQLQMAQFTSTSTSTNTSTSNSNTSSNNINSEEPVALVQRLRFPSSYPVAVQQSCGMAKDEEIGEYLDGALEVQTPKNVASVVEMKFRARSVAQARQCAEALVMMIVAQQRGLIEDLLAGRQELLLQLQQALREQQQQLDVIKKSELANVAYLARLDQLSGLHTRIEALQEEALLSQQHPAKLTAPIFVPSKPVSPKADISLILGVLLGLMLGVLHALGRAGWRREA